MKEFGIREAFRGGVDSKFRVTEGEGDRDRDMKLRGEGGPMLEEFIEVSRAFAFILEVKDSAIVNPSDNLEAASEVATGIDLSVIRAEGQERFHKFLFIGLSDSREDGSGVHAFKEGDKAIGGHSAVFISNFFNPLRAFTEEARNKGMRANEFTDREFNEFRAFTGGDSFSEGDGVTGEDILKGITIVSFKVTEAHTVAGGIDEFFITGFKSFFRFRGERGTGREGVKDEGFEFFPEGETGVNEIDNRLTLPPVREDTKLSLFQVNFQPILSEDGANRFRELKEGIAEYAFSPPSFRGGIEGHGMVLNSF